MQMVARVALVDLCREESSTEISENLQLFSISVNAAVAGVKAGLPMGRTLYGLARVGLAIVLSGLGWALVASSLG
jgi:hypothetical protein